MYYNQPHQPDDDTTKRYDAIYQKENKELSIKALEDRIASLSKRRVKLTRQSEKLSKEISECHRQIEKLNQV